MKSTIEHPLEFFEYIINEENIIELIHKEYTCFDGYYDIEFPFRVHCSEINYFGEFESTTHPIGAVISNALKREFYFSKEIIYKAYEDKTNKKFKRYANLQFIIIQNLINTKFETINKFPVIGYALIGLMNYLNMLLSNENDKLELDLNKIDLDAKPYTYFEDNDEAIIYEVFGYMQNKNQKGELILNVVDFNLLISYIKYLVKHEEVPSTVSRKLKPKLSNDLLRFSFWVLHKELYTRKRIRSYFYDFIKSVFENFSDSTIESIKKQFGTKIRVKKDDFIPEIIKKNL
ncbi:hypothetical protein [Flavobacterium oreochromis]|uniref:Uncharacterized protein n=1 Tax=Flavobacterium oreochromis TaxID=2906078 RepID=A0ABW8P879_9FLAO|nr:hypothetical protein [Flavobacterium oreochromis]OWP78544.1 hypothetical protein BWG23_01915 [Flavobacterium oreochromis]